MQLRDYQLDAVASCYRHFHTSDPKEGGLVCLPTGSGKTPVIAQLCLDAVSKCGARALVLTHVRELVEQNAAHLREFGVDASVYCAGLKRKEADGDVIVASVQSLYRRPEAAGKINLAIIDEAHLLADSSSSMYRVLLASLRLANPRLRLVGATATPFRLESGPLVSAAGPFHRMVYQARLIDLIRDKWLCPLVAKGAVAKIDTRAIKLSCGDFAAAELGAAANGVVEQAAAEIAKYAADRRAALVFAAGVDHAKQLAAILARHGVPVGTVFGETPSDERDAIVGRFRSGELKALVNCRVLTTGFNVPHVDLIAICTATMSKGLYSQMAGRGLRLAPGKENCLLLDFGGNVRRHGCLDDPDDRPDEVRECPKCQRLCRRGENPCPDCGYEWYSLQAAPVAPPVRVIAPTHAGTADDLDPLTPKPKPAEIRETLDVDSVEFDVHEKRGAPAGHPPTMQVTYRVGLNGRYREFVCFQHQGFARGLRCSESFPTQRLIVAQVFSTARSRIWQTGIRTTSWTKMDGRQVKPRPLHSEATW